MVLSEVDTKKPVGGIAFVIFGVTGDLTRRKLIPALYELLLAQRLPTPISIIGFARREWDDEKLKQVLRDGVNEFAHEKPVKTKILEQLLENAHYVQSTFSEQDGYRRLGALIEKLERPNVLYYLATPPDSYNEIIQNIGKQGLNQRSKGWERIVLKSLMGATFNRLRN